jgi:polysaccharide pyruvyl transferase WcaK-like protein
VSDKRDTIGIITPYTGSNLGDGAIQDGVIENIKRRLPDNAICMFSLAPHKTALLHNIPSQPVTGMIISNYSNTLKMSRRHIDNSASVARLLERIKQKAWNNPAVSRVMRFSWAIAKGFINVSVNAWCEITHIIKMYSILRCFNLLIVSGGGQIDDYWGGPLGHPYVLFKWAILAKVAGVRFVYLSVGVCSLNSQLSKIFMSTSLKTAEYRSYRDAGSRDLLQGMKFTKKDRIVPDLAFSYPMGEISIKRKSENNEKEYTIGISPIAYLLKGHWPKDDKKIFEQYTETLAIFMSEILSRGHQVVLFATDAPDQEVVELLIARLDEGRNGARSLKMRQAKLENTRDLITELQSVDFVIASRLHGVILSHLCLKPVLAISYDRKVSEYMKEMEQQDICLDIHNIRLQDLKEGFDCLLKRRDTIQISIAEKVGRYRDEVMSQYEHVLLDK